VAAVHHEFARSAQVRQLQAERGALGGVLNRGGAEKMLAEAEAAGMPHFTTVPWKSMGNVSHGCCSRIIQTPQRLVYFISNPPYKI
jgi:hypothetical protein